MVPAAGASTLTVCPSRSSAAASPTTCACTPPGTSSEYGQTIPTRSGRRVMARPGRSAVQIGCSACQSAGAEAMSRANASATACVAFGTAARSATGTGSAMGAVQPSGVKCG